MRMFAGLVFGLLMTATPIVAQEVATTASPEGISEKMAKRMKTAPEAFLADAAGLILGYGAEGGIDSAGIDRAIAVDRAAARAAEMRRMMLADLDGDGTAGREEVAVLVQAASANSRGRILLAFEAADTDDDGTVTAPEMGARSADAGVKAVSVAKVAAMRGLMALDRDGNGLLSLDEVREGLKRAQEAA
jgi:hypothetical protein